MASSEMQIITSDKWTDDVWGVSTAREPLSKLFFYFGYGDHWVADRTRDEIIELRGRTEKRNGPEMFVCEDGLPHAFCLSTLSRFPLFIFPLLRYFLCIILGLVTD